MGRTLGVVLAATLTAVAPAHGKSWSTWVQCDGYAKAEAAVARTAKLVAAVSTLGLFGIPETFNPEGRAAGDQGVRACETVLADPALSSAAWLRRVTLNQALAVHHLEARRPESALAAIASAEVAAKDRSADPLYQRSTGVSLKLLKSMALLGAGKPAEAAAAAQQAAEARPYSARIQSIALVLMGGDGQAAPQELALAERAVALDPSGGEQSAASLIESGRYAEAWRLIRPGWDRRRAAPPPKGTAILADRRQSEALLAAFVAARAGDHQGAAEVLDQYERELKPAAEELRGWTVKVRKEPDPGPALEASFLKPVAEWRNVIESVRLLNAGDNAAARTKLDSAAMFLSLPLIAKLRTEIDALKEASLQQSAAALPNVAGEQANAGAWLDRLQRLDFFAVLPEPESQERLNQYSRQAGLGLKETGFKHKLLENGLTRVEFVGSVSSALAVEEMTMLRAADLALKAGRRAFRVEGRSDYTRSRYMTYGGSQVGPSTHAGYKTELLVRFLDDATGVAVHDAQKVHDALAPIYASRLD